MATQANTADTLSYFKDEKRCASFKGGIQELKSFAAPPQAIKDTLAAVALLMDKDPSWVCVKKLMANPKSFLDLLKNFDKDKVKPEDMQRVREYTSKSDFNPESVEKKSKAAALLCKWVLAVEQNYTNK